MKASEITDVAAAPALRRVVTLPWLVLYGLGTTIGAGIYALTGVVAGRAGMHAPACFVFASLIALFSALSFAELASRYPLAGGEAVYVREGLRSKNLGAVVGLMVVAAGLISAATVTVGFVGYLTAFVQVPRGPSAVAMMLGVGVIASVGIRVSVLVAGLMTVVEVAGLLAVIFAGSPQFADLPERWHELIPREFSAWQAVASAAILSFYAFLGFEDMVNLAEEVRDVRRAMPRAIVITLAATTLLYVLVTTVAVLAVSPEELAASDSPLVLVFERSGAPGAVLGLIALVALMNGALIQVVKAARVLFSLADQGSLPAVLGAVHPRTRTPLRATLLATLVAASFAGLLPLETLAAATSLVTLLAFALTNISLLVLKRREPTPEGVVAYPVWVPMVGASLCGLIVLFEVANRLGSL